MREVCEFSTVEGFWRYWAFIPRPRWEQIRLFLWIKANIFLYLSLWSEVFCDGGTTKREIMGKTIEGFSIFKKGIKPEWEDPANANGSELQCRKMGTDQILDQYWENMVLAVIGEAMDDSNEICGCRVVDKSGKRGLQFRLELWLSSNTPEVADRIRHRLLDALSDGEYSKNGKVRGLPDFEFKKHTA